MATFDCDWCGKCCRSFGEFIRIERQLTSRDYYCRYGITNELFFVHVQPEFADEIAGEFEEPGRGNGSDRNGCIFSFRNPAGLGFACAIYPTRPSVCREFRCYRMLIRYPVNGEVRGKVIWINELRTKDPVLMEIWAGKIAPLPHPVHGGHTQAHHAHAPGAPAPHGHDAHLHGTGHTDDREWLNNVITILAAHGYHGDPVVD